MISVWLGNIPKRQDMDETGRAWRDDCALHLAFPKVRSYL